MHFHIYLKNGKVYLPTTAQTDAEYYLDIEPVEVVSLEDTDELVRAIERMINRGNPDVPAPMRWNFPKPVILRHANVRSWSTFEKGADSWEINEEGGQFEISRRLKTPPRGFEPDPTTLEKLARGTTVTHVAQRLVERIKGS